MIVKITVTPDEVRSDYPEIIWENAKGCEKEALDNVKGACLHAIGDWSTVPNTVTFMIVKRLT
jgi:hypothetical protein